MSRASFAPLAAALIATSRATAMHSNGTGVRISGVGAEIPPDVVTTAEVEERAGLKRLGFEPGWLERVTGVRERRIAAPDVLPSQLSVAAATRALADAGIGPLDVDTLIFTGITRDCMEPATANVVADALGAREARVFDLDNACNGVIDGLDVADSLIRTGKARRVLIATGERASWSINWHPQSREETLRSVAGLVVGDGGGAFVVGGRAGPQRGPPARALPGGAAPGGPPPRGRGPAAAPGGAVWRRAPRRGARALPAGVGRGPGPCAWVGGGHGKEKVGPPPPPGGPRGGGPPRPAPPQRPATTCSPSCGTCSAGTSTPATCATGTSRA